MFGSSSESDSEDEESELEDSSGLCGFLYIQQTRERERQS